MGLSTPVDAVASLDSPLIYKLDSVNVSQMAAVELVEFSAVRDTWPAIFLPKSKVTAELAEKAVVPLTPFKRPSALSTVPFIPYMATGKTVREVGAKIYSL